MKLGWVNRWLAQLLDVYRCEPANFDVCQYNIMDDFTWTSIADSYTRDVGHVTIRTPHWWNLSCVSLESSNCLRASPSPRYDISSGISTRVFLFLYWRIFVGQCKLNLSGFSWYQQKSRCCRLLSLADTIMYSLYFSQDVRARYMGPPTRSVCIPMWWNITKPYIQTLSPRIKSLDTHCVLFLRIHGAERLRTA